MHFHLELLVVHHIKKKKQHKYIDISQRQFMGFWNSWGYLILTSKMLFQCNIQKWKVPLWEFVGRNRNMQNSTSTIVLLQCIYLDHLSHTFAIVAFENVKGRNCFATNIVFIFINLYQAQPCYLFYWLFVHPFNVVFALIFYLLHKGLKDDKTTFRSFLSAL